MNFYVVGSTVNDWMFSGLRFKLKTRFMLRILFHIFLFVSSILSLKGQFTPLSYTQTGSFIHQNFNGLPSSGSLSLAGKGPHSLSNSSVITTGLEGWYILQVAGSQTNTNFSASTGSATGSGVYSYGTGSNRALGSIASGTGIYAFGLVLKNETGLILNRIQIRFLATQWRKGGSGNKNNWVFGYQAGNADNLLSDTLKPKPTLNIYSLHTSSGAATLNGHLVQNQIWIEDSLTDISWLPGQVLRLQWSDTDETGSDDGMAVDDFSLLAFQQTGAPEIQQIKTDSIGSNNVVMSAYINDQLLATTVKVLIDTTADLQNATPLKEVIPSMIEQGSGHTRVIATAAALLPAKKYYYRFIAQNQQATICSPIQYFTTKPALPVIRTDSLVQTGPYECRIYVSIPDNGGAPILEKGICWGTDALPLVSHNTLLIANEDPFFSANLYQLPSGSKLYFRSYCRNAAGISYGNTVSWFTPTSVLHFSRRGNDRTNKDTIIYEITFKEKVNGIQATDFYIASNQPTSAKIITVTAQNLVWKISIETGNTDGIITPVFKPADHPEPSVLNVPYEATAIMIDKTGPVIRSLQIENRPYKSGDTVWVMIETKPEKGLLNFLNGNLAGYPLQQFTGIHDSLWKTYCIIRNNGKEVKAEENILVSLILTDETGNQNTENKFIIQQSNDAIDLTRPSIDRISVPDKKIYKAGDILFFSIRFSEPVMTDSTHGSPVLAVTVGTRIKNPFLYRIIHDSIFIFCYTVQPDDLDMDGIRVANTITLNNSIITDKAGNLLVNTIANAGIFSEIKIDAVAPVITNVLTPVGRTYGLGDTLYFSIFISKPLAISSQAPSPWLEITVGNTIHRTKYITGSSTMLRFYWPIQEGVSDKDGLNMANQLFNVENMKDSSGNSLLPALKNIGNLSQVFVDGISPYFRDTVSVIDVCKNSFSTLVHALQIHNAEQGENIQWSMIEGPLKGQIEGFPFSTRWNATSQPPSHVFYSPKPNTGGTDECVLQVSDGIHTIQKRIRFQINDPIKGNTISSDQIICAGFTAQPLKGALLTGGNGVYHFSWQSDNNNQVYQQAEGIHNKEIYQPLPLQSSRKFRRIVSSGNCTDTSSPIHIQVRSNGLWLGNQSNQWNAGGNWCGGIVPDNQTDVQINTSLQKNIIEINDTARCRSLYVDSTALLLLNAPFIFSGTLSGNNAIDATNGTLISAGREKQLLHTSIFIHKTIARLLVSSIDLTLNDTLFINDYFAVQKGIFQTNNLLVLNPNASNHANASDIQLKGDILLRHIFHGRAKERFIHHPFKKNLLNYNPENPALLKEKDIVYFQSGLPVADSIFILNNEMPVNLNMPDFIWQGITTNHLQWKPGNGILFSKPGHSDMNNRSLTMHVKSELNTGNIDTELFINNDSNYVLTGNPYMSTINSKYIIRSEGIGNYYWIWDTGLAEKGAYLAKNFSANNSIQPMEGFMVKAIAGKPLVLSYTEQAKLLNILPDSLEGELENTYQISIDLLKDNIIHDKLQILDVDSARTRYDATDAEKIMNPESNLYSLSADTIPLSVDARWLTNRTYIPLGIDSKTKGEFTISFSRVSIKPGIHLELHDFFTGSKIKIDSNHSYKFHITGDPASWGRNRFVIRYPSTPEPIQETLSLQLYPVPAIQTLMIVVQAKEKAINTILIKNMQGQVLLSRSMGEQQDFTQQISIARLLKGHYIVEVHAGKYVIAKPFIKL